MAHRCFGYQLPVLFLEYCHSWHGHTFQGGIIHHHMARRCFGYQSSLKIQHFSSRSLKFIVGSLVISKVSVICRLTCNWIAWTWRNS
ncbi:GSCOCG00005251001-RA-CDS [Cotesia congregata]|nr:GSCOCG00005251001-RA-CDS [Cotesia congregata]